MQAVQLLFISAVRRPGPVAEFTPGNSDYFIWGKNLLAVTQIEPYLARVSHLLNPPTTEL